MKHFSSITILAAFTLLAGCTSTPTPPAATSAKPSRPATTATATAPARPTGKPATPAGSTNSASTAETTKPSAPPSATPLPPPKLTPEAEAVVYRFTHAASGSTAHELAESTGFPSALASLQTGAPAPKVETLGNVTLPPPKGLTADGNSTELVERDWTGLVLVPVNAALAKAYTTQVRLLKVEAHPLHDGRLRIWARIRNVSDRTLPAEIACSFRMRGETTANSPYFYQLQVPSGAYRDVFFVSPDGELSAYTVLVRSEEMWKQK
ncbi:MAG: hypothetical protein QM760_12835 [Nibricoccus sp.]